MRTENLNNNLKYLIVFLLGLYVGLEFPDKDQMFQKSLGHRSIITHSILLPLLLILINSFKPKILINIFIIGVFLGIGLHLSADLHPKNWNWYGYANIKLPSNKSIGALSPIWIAGNAIISVFFSIKILFKNFNKKLFKFSYVIIALVTGTFYSIFEPYNQMVILVTYLLIFLGAFYFTHRRNSKSNN